MANHEFEIKYWTESLFNCRLKPGVDNCINDILHIHFTLHSPTWPTILVSTFNVFIHKVFREFLNKRSYPPFEKWGFSFLWFFKHPTYHSSIISEIGKGYYHFCTLNNDVFTQRTSVFPFSDVVRYLFNDLICLIVANFHSALVPVQSENHVGVDQEREPRRRLYVSRYIMVIWRMN